MGKVSEKASIERTALLCKADLLTKLVYEFTELEGFIGANYALKTGETQAVANGIKEHYFPLGADSDVAQSIEGQVVGIVDKIDTIVTTFAVGKKPTGSADPLGIRRATLGVITTVLKNDLQIDISDIIAKTIDEAPIEISDKAALLVDINEFFVGRLKILLQQNYKYDLIDAVCSVKSPLEDICDLKLRLDLLTSLAAGADFEKLNDSINRIIRIIKDAKADSFDESLFVFDAEKGLCNALQSINDKNGYDTLIVGLKSIGEPISKFFDDVLVMDKDEKIKQNRINLLASVKSKFELIADFSKIVI
jgi:glycyl-tRNA synthetase beta chain